MSAYLSIYLSIFAYMNIHGATDIQNIVFGQVSDKRLR